MASPVPREPGSSVQEAGSPRLRIGYVHVDSSELRLAEGKLTMVLAIDRASKFTCVEFRDAAGKMNGAEFRCSVVAAFPHATHTVLTDNRQAIPGGMSAKLTGAWPLPNG